jgi:hypothetical protein
MPDTTPKAVEDCHELLLWMIPHIDKFPRHRRFTLGERLESGLLETLEALVSAAYARDKRADLDLANRRVNAVRHDNGYRFQRKFRRMA